MKYNFKTQRGYITEVITEQQDGYLTGGKAKRTEDGAFYVEDGKYTTCEDHEHPHFYFQLTKAKVRPKKDVVTGPGYMVLADVPLPLALPFGYFPFSEKYSSGIIFPLSATISTADSIFATEVTTSPSTTISISPAREIYTKGSWGLSGHLNYVKRYKFRGAFDISFLNTVTGDRGTPDYNSMRNFQVVWSHSQDAKANPNLNFSASVNFATSGYSRNDLNSYYNQNFTENTKSSTVNLTYRFPGTKWSLSATANITQRTQDSTLQVSFPNINVTMSQTAPFKRKRAAGAERWYEKIKLSYSGQFQNSLTSGQDEFFKKSLIKDWRNGMKHSVPVSATFSLFKYLNVSPSISLNDRMYTSRYAGSGTRRPHAKSGHHLRILQYFRLQPLHGIRHESLRILEADKVSRRQGRDDPARPYPDRYRSTGNPTSGCRDRESMTITPTSTPRATSNGTTIRSSTTESSRVPGRGRQGAVSVNLVNNLEMKVKSDKDSTGVRKISLIENTVSVAELQFRRRLAQALPLQLNVMLRIVKNFNLNFNTTWDPYSYRLNEAGTPVQVDRYCWQDGRFLQLSSFGTSFSYTFNNDTFRRKKITGRTGAETMTRTERMTTNRRNMRKASPTWPAKKATPAGRGFRNKRR